MQEIRNGSAWCTNSHAENTRENGLRLLVDWVSCSFYFASEVADLIGILGLSDLEFVTTDGARYEGYIKTHKADSIEILESDDGKYLLNFRGQACRLYEQYSTLPWRNLFALLSDFFSAKFNRLDLAIDDFGEIFRVSTIRQAVYKKLCVTRLTDWGDGRRGKIAHGDDFLTMDSFYIGGASSRYHLNFYDKKIERESKGKTVTVDSWTRTELRLKAEYATEFVRRISEEGVTGMGYYVMSFINDRIQFLKPGNYTNKSRAAKDPKNISRWWKKFLGKAGKINLSQQAPDKTLDDVIQWVWDDVSPSLAMIYEADPSTFEDKVHALLLHGQSKFKQRHLSILHNAALNKKKT